MKKTLLSRLLVGVAGSFVLASAASAATYYVRAGATGANNGSDWANAWSSISAVRNANLVAGDTVYVAAGNYGALTVNRSGAAGSPITIKRATAAAHGTDTGWSSGYDAKVIFDGGDGLCAVCIGDSNQANYVTIDGATRYGMVLRNAYHGVRTRGPNNAAHNLTLRYLEIGDAGAYKTGEDGIQGMGNNLVLEKSYIHDNDTPETHGDGIQWFEGDNVTMRYNVFKNNGQQMMLTETAWGNDYVTNLNIYYNVFYNRGGYHYNGISKKLCPPSGQWKVYNNTFDLEAPTSGWEDEIFSGAGSCKAMVFVNNAVVNSRAGSVGNLTHNNNAYDNSSPYFVYGIPSESGSVVTSDLGLTNVSAADYRPTTASPLIGRGVNVGLTVDFDGKPVPSTPTIGAFEPGTGSGGTTEPTPPAATSPAAPTNLRVTQ